MNMNNQIMSKIQLDEYNTPYSYTNIDVNLSLSFNNLSYTLVYENMNKNYLSNNSLLFNIEDGNTIYNIFKRNHVQFAYQLNNILYIDNEKNMHTLNYNLNYYDESNSKNTSLFSINENNIISFNILENKNISKYAYQTVFAYNSSNYSYIYSNEEKLPFISFDTQGLYNIDNNNVILEEDKLSINLGKFNYNYKYLQNINTKILHTLNNYQKNIDLFSQTSKYKNINHSSADIEFIPPIKNYQNNYIDNTISITTLNKNYKINYSNNTNNNEIIIKDTNYLIIDLPIEYKYETVVNKDYQYNKRICQIDINNVRLEINETAAQTDISKFISINHSKSFIHDNKCLLISADNKTVDSLPIMTESCRMSIYLDIDEEIYNYIFNNPTLFKFGLSLLYNKIEYKFYCYVDIMNNRFKKLYHNYNYGFNFDNHGDAIGIMLLRKNTNINYNINNISFDIHDETSRPIISDESSMINNIVNLYDTRIKLKEKLNIKTNIVPINKDIFISYDQYSIDNIFINIDKANINNSQISNFTNIEYCDANNINSLSTFSSFNGINILDEDFNKNLIYPDRLKIKDLTFLYKLYENHDGLSISDISINRYRVNSEDQNKKLILNNIFVDTGVGIIKLCKYNNSQSIVNNPYFIDRDRNKNLFNNVYNHKKSGLLFGDLYTPCIQDYMMIYLFSIEKYFDEKIYNQYFKRFCKEDYIDPENKNLGIKKYHLLSSQFYKSNDNKIYQYMVNLTKDDNHDFNEYTINLYDYNIQNTENDKNYIWPLFRIPDYSIINSNDYIIMFSENENCEYIDYYINTNDSKYIYINFRSYITKKIDDFKFNIFDENLKLTQNDQNIKINSYELVDNKNDIYKMQLYINTIEKIKVFYIAFTDSEDYMNNYVVNSKKYRILCKVYLKNESI